MCPAWAITWWWKSTTGLAVGTVSSRQGCPPWGGIWRKPAAKSRTDGQKLYIRLNWNGWVCKSKRSPILHKFHTVNTAVKWEEGYSSYPGRSHGRVKTRLKQDLSWEVSRNHSNFLTEMKGGTILNLGKTGRCRHHRRNAENIVVKTDRWLPMER